MDGGHLMEAIRKILFLDALFALLGTKCINKEWFTQILAFDKRFPFSNEN